MNFFKSEKIKINENIIFTSIFLLLVIVRIWLIISIPKMTINGTYDDLYFAREANYLLHRKWLGPYDQFTLIKVPFYSLFLALSFLTGLPLFLNETLFYICACILVFFAMSPLISNRWCRLLLFTFLLFCPVSLATEDNIRVYRTFVYFSLTLFVVAFSIGLLLRLSQKKRFMAIWAIGLGISMGAFMITREEGIWIYPLLIPLLVCGVIAVWVRKMESAWLRTAILLLPIVLWYVPIFFVSYLNYSYYGFFGTTEELDPGFTRVINNLGRIKSSYWYPHIGVTKEALQQAYAVSPTFSELKESIENSISRWQPYSSEGLSTKPDWYIQQFSDHGTEIGVGHFLWVLREAINSRGYFSNGKYPADIFNTIGDELDEACKNGKLKCSQPGFVPFIGSIDQRHIPIIFRMFSEDIVNLLKQNFDRMPNMRIADLNLSNWPQYNEFKTNYDYFNQIINSPIDLSMESSNYLLEIHGWAFSNGSDPIDFIFIDDNNNQQINGYIKTNLPSPDVYTNFLRNGLNLPLAKESRFELLVPRNAYRILVVSNNEVLLKIPIVELSQPYSYSNGKLTLTIESAKLQNNFPKDLRTKGLLLRADFMRGIVGVYDKILLPLTIVSLLGLLLLLIIRIFTSVELIPVIIIAYSLGLFLTRSLLLIIADATTNGSMITYAASTYLYLYLFIFLTIYICATGIKKIIRKFSAKNDIAFSEKIKVIS